MGYIVIRKGVSGPIPEFTPLGTLPIYVKCIPTPCTVVSTLPLLPLLLLAKLLYVAKHWVAGTMSGNLIQKPHPLRRGVLHKWALVAHTQLECVHRILTLYTQNSHVVMDGNGRLCR